MNAPRHAPGPWHTGEGKAESIVYNCRGWAVANATVYHGTMSQEEIKANAQLIAAAPELLGIIQGFMGLDDSNEPREAFEDHARDILQRLGVGAQ